MKRAGGGKTEKWEVGGKGCDVDADADAAPAPLMPQFHRFSSPRLFPNDYEGVDTPRLLSQRSETFGPLPIKVGTWYVVRSSSIISQAPHRYTWTRRHVDVGKGFESVGRRRT